MKHNNNVSYNIYECPDCCARSTEKSFCDRCDTEMLNISVARD